MFEIYFQDQTRLVALPIGFLYYSVQVTFSHYTGIIDDEISLIMLDFFLIYCPFSHRQCQIPSQVYLSVSKRWTLKRGLLQALFLRCAIGKTEFFLHRCKKTEPFNFSKSGPDWQLFHALKGLLKAWCVARYFQVCVSRRRKRTACKGMLPRYRGLLHEICHSELLQRQSNVLSLKRSFATNGQNGPARHALHRLSKKAFSLSRLWHSSVCRLKVAEKWTSKNGFLS